MVNKGFGSSPAGCGLRLLPGSSGASPYRRHEGEMGDAVVSALQVDTSGAGLQSKRACRLPLHHANVARAAFCRLNAPSTPTRGPKVDHEWRRHDQLPVDGCCSPGAFRSAPPYAIPPLTRLSGRNMPKNRPKAAAGNTAILQQTEPSKRIKRRLTIVNAAPYVGRMTKAANEGKSLACQGLHKCPVLAYGSSCTAHLAVASHVV